MSQMNQVTLLQQALQQNAAVQNFTVFPGPHGPTNTVAVALADMTKISASAYVVPHFQNAVSYGGVARP